MIKLAIISDDPGRGGAYKVAHDIAIGLPKAQYEVQFFFLCERPSTFNAPEGIYLGAPKFDFDFSLRDYLKLAFFPSKAQQFYTPLNEALRDFQPNLIHIHTHIILLPLLKGINIKKIFTDHSQRIRENEYGFLKIKIMSIIFKKIMAYFNVVFVSKYAYKTAINLGFANNVKDCYIKNSIDLNIFYCSNSKDKPSLNIIYLSRLCNGKGHDTLLDAWSRLEKKEGLELHFYGVEADGGHIRARIEKSNYENPVRYMGITTNPSEVLREASIGVFPSQREGMPLALLEMMATGLPIVASDIPEIKTLVQDQKEILLFKCGDAVELAEKLKKVIENSTLRKELGANARKKVEKDYSKPLWQSYHDYYQKLLKY